MMQINQQISLSLWQNIKQNSKAIVGIAALSVLGIAAYMYRIKQHKKLYQQKIKHIFTVQQQQNFLKRQETQNYKSIQILTKNNQMLIGWHIKANIKLRNPKKLIIFFHSQHTSNCCSIIEIYDNLSYVKQVVQYTICDVLIVQYRYQPYKRSQGSMKQDAYEIFRKSLEIANKQNKQIVILGKDLGAALGIYVCSLSQFRYLYQLKGLIIQNPIYSLIDLKIQSYTQTILKQALTLLYGIVLKDKWQSFDLIKKLRIPTLLVIDQLGNYKSAIKLYANYHGTKYISQFSNLGQKGWKRNITGYFMEINIFLNQLV